MPEIALWPICHPEPVLNVDAFVAATIRNGNVPPSLSLTGESSGIRTRDDNRSRILTRPQTIRSTHSDIVLCGGLAEQFLNVSLETGVILQAVPIQEPIVVVPRQKHKSSLIRHIKHVRVIVQRYRLICSVSTALFPVHPRCAKVCRCCWVSGCGCVTGRRLSG